MNAYKIFLDELRLATSQKFIEYIQYYVDNDFSLIKFDYIQNAQFGTYLIYIMTNDYSFHFSYRNDKEDGYLVHQMSNRNIISFNKWINEEFKNETHYKFPDSEHLIIENPSSNLIKPTKKRF